MNKSLCFKQSEVLAQVTSPKGVVNRGLLKFWKGSVMQKHQNRMKSGVEGPQAPEKNELFGPELCP
jgi:hypothetical protein